MKRRLISFALCLVMVSSILVIQAQTSETPVVVRSTAYGAAYKNTDLTFEERAADLVSRLSNRQKAQQISNHSGNDYVKTPAIPALGIGDTSLWSEALHGVARQGIATSFPTALSMASSWDEDLMLKMMTVASTEARAKDWLTGRGLMYFSPTINLSRDPRWGRNDESYGEDPYLTAVMGSAFVKGFQGDNPNDPYHSDKYLKAVATIKHYAANNSEGNRSSGSSNMDDRDLREYYTAAFQKVVETAQPASVMGGYNRVNEIPMPVNTYLNDRLLRKTWGFEGYVVTDCGAFGNVSGSHSWRPNGWNSPDGLWKSPDLGRRVTAAEAIAFGIASGNDAECGSSISETNVINALNPERTQDGANVKDFFNEDILNQAAYRLMKTRMSLGQFDPAEGNPYRQITADVLEAPDSLALSLQASRQSPVLLKNKGNILPLDAKSAKSIVVLGALANICELGDYSGSPTVLVNFKKGLTDFLEKEGYTGTLEFYNGIDGLPGYKSDRDAAMAAAKEADIVIAYVGTDRTGLFSTASENSDRAASLALPRNQADMISAIDNDNIVVVMSAVGYHDVNSFIDKVKGMIFTCYNGPYQGTAMAELLFGKANPSGHLTFTWYSDITNKKLSHIADYRLRVDSEEKYFQVSASDANRGDYASVGRTYQYYDGGISYPFGYGLSYSDFKVDNFSISETNAVPAGKKVDVTCTVTNNGAKGAELVQVYMVSPMRLEGNNQYPKKQLKGFARVELDKGESKEVTIQLDTNEFYFIDSTGKPGTVFAGGDIVNDAGRRVVPGGAYEIQVATSAADSDILEKFNLNITSSEAIAPTLKNVTLSKEKVVAMPGDEFNARVVTVMSDETYLTSGADITYTSSRPSVATVDPGTGKIKAVAPGTTIITVAVSKDGVTLSDTAPLAVCLKKTLWLDNITLDGTRLPSFNLGGSNPATRHVVELQNVDVKPEVAATSPDEATKVVVTQAGTGNTALITVTDKDGDSVVYTIEFQQALPEVTELTTEYGERFTAGTGAFAGSKMRNISIVTGEDVVVPFMVTASYAKGSQVTVSLSGTDGTVYDSVVLACNDTVFQGSGLLKIAGKAPVDNLTITASIGGTNAKKATVIPSRNFEDVASIMFNPSVAASGNNTVIRFMTGIVSTSNEQWGPGTLDTGVDLSKVKAYADFGEGLNPVNVVSVGAIHSTTMGQISVGANFNTVKEIKLVGVKFIRILPSYEFTITVRPNSL